MIGRFLFLSALSLACAGCCRPLTLASRDSPFGLWSTERGQTVEVWRNGVYRFCDGQDCETGHYTRDGRTLVKLDGFFDMKATRRLSQISGLDERRLLDKEIDQGLKIPPTKEIVEIGDGGMDDNYRLELCQGRPCIIIGRENYDVMRFVKLKDG